MTANNNVCTGELSDDILETKYSKILGNMRKRFSTGVTLPYEFRMKQLRGLQKMLEERSDEIVDALYADMRKPKFEVYSCELDIIKSEIINIMRNLKKWMATTKLPTSMLLWTDRSEVSNDPYGIVLIIGAWNYPFMLSLAPLCGCIAGGNFAILKPSEVSSHSAAKIAELLPQYLDPKCYQVILGDARDTRSLLANRFDYIFCTSSLKVGKIVMTAAAKYVTPVTLELGGKSPVYIEDSANLAKSAKRILWGKILNSGQTCIAPDYILCSKKVETILISHFKRLLKKFYGDDDPQTSKDIARIVNRAHFERLKRLIVGTKGDITIGGELDVDDLWISPTIITNVTKSDIVMEEEIFGPILPIVNCNSPEEALMFITARPKPLSVYLFTKTNSTMSLFRTRSSSGSLNINDVCVQVIYEGLPFGGVGESGIGRYRWNHSYETFVHKKGVFTRDFGLYSTIVGELMHPPYEFANFKIWFLKNILYLKGLTNLPTRIRLHIFSFCLGMLAFFLLVKFTKIC